MVNDVSTKILNYPSRFQIFEKAREATLALLTLRDILTPSEKESLEILFDKKSISQLSESLREAKEGNFEPIENILK